VDEHPPPAQETMGTKMAVARITGTISLQLMPESISDTGFFANYFFGRAASACVCFACSMFASGYSISV